MSKKSKFFYRLLFIIIALLLIYGVTQRYAVVSGINMFPVKNIVEVGLIGLIVILIAILLKKYFFRDEFDIPVIMLLKKYSSRRSDRFVVRAITLFNDRRFLRTE